MSVTGISPSVSMMHAQQVAQRPAGIERPEHSAPSTPGFAERIGQAVDRVADQQARASEAAKAYETGKTDDLAAVMVEQQVSSLGFQMTLQVRNKALTAYRDIMNMPV